jgi:glycosyltransferase involved in cell wall biosynthesis
MNSAIMLGLWRKSLNMNQLISIVIPAYNVEQYIAECLQSVQQQTYENWEAIVVDDGSADQTAAVIQAIIQHDQRFRLIRQQNGGVSTARNAGMRAASGMYLSFLDGDDLWQPTFLEKMLATVQANDVEMAYCGYTHLYSSGVRRKFSYPYAGGRILWEVIQGKTQIHIGAILVEKDLLDQSGLLFTEGCRVGQDQEFLWKLVSQAKVQAVPQELMIYRIRKKSTVTSKWQWQNHIHAIYGFQRAAAYILQNLPPGYDRERLNQALNQRIAYKLYKLIWRMIKNGYHDEARQLINSEEYPSDLSYLELGKLKVDDRIKFKIVSSQDRTWWKLAKLL